jgi:hypothetical protein
MYSAPYSCQVLDLKFLDWFSKKAQKPNYIQIRPVRAELLHADGRKGRQADMTKLTVAFRNFANEPKNDRMVEK